MINLTEEDKEKIRYIDHAQIINLSIGSYLVKEDFEETGINEVICKKIAGILNVNCPNYKMVKVDNDWYVLSENLNSKFKFTTAVELLAHKSDYEDYPMKDLYQDDSWYDEEAKNLLHGHSLYDIWVFLERNYDETTTRILMRDLVKIYIFDVLFLNYDRSLSNWGILTAPNGQVDIVMFDNELILCQSTIFSETVSMNVNFLYDSPYIYDDFKRFLKESSKEFIDLFKYYFDQITPERFKSLIESSEKEIGLKKTNKDETIELYKRHRNNLIKIFNEEMQRGESHGR